MNKRPSVKEKAVATQLQVAVRQLEVAIRLFFQEEDVFAIYSLTRNAEKIIAPLLAKKGAGTLWDFAQNAIKPEYRKRVRQFADKPYNQLKHPVKREDEIVTLSVGLNELFLLFCVNALHVHWSDIWMKSPDCMVFVMWSRTHNPEAYLTKVNLPEGDKQLSKRDFYAKWIEGARAFQAMQRVC